MDDSENIVCLFVCLPTYLCVAMGTDSMEQRPSKEVNNC
jgi:hypothetical protein